MKKAIITLAITVFIAGTALIMCQSSAIKAESTQDKATIAKQELYQGLKDSLQQFNKESEAKIGNYEMSILPLRYHLKSENLQLKKQFPSTLLPQS